jgi:hypothetical protein
MNSYFRGICPFCGRILLGEPGSFILRNTLLYQTLEDPDGMLKLGMEEGSVDSMDPLAEFLAKI